MAELFLRHTPSMCPTYGASRGGPVLCPCSHHPPLRAATTLGEFLADEALEEA